MTLKSYFLLGNPKGKKTLDCTTLGKICTLGLPNFFYKVRADPDLFRSANMASVTQGNSCPVITPYCEHRGTGWFVLLPLKTPLSRG